MNIQHLKHFVFMRNLGTPKKTARGVDFPFGLETLRVEFVREDIVRLRVSTGGEFVARASAALREDLKYPRVAFTVVTRGKQTCVKTGSLTVTITRDPFAIRIHRADGTLILQDHREQGNSQFYGELNDCFAGWRSYAPGDLIYGLGQKTGGSNRRGRSFILWNTDILGPAAQDRLLIVKKEDPRGTRFDPYYMSVPFFYHQSIADGKMAGFFINNPYKAECKFADGDAYSFLFHGGQYDEFIFAGPDMSAILEGYAWLTGKMPMPPMWALGHHQCRATTYTTETFKQLGREYRQRNIPCDALWFDIGHMKDFQVFTWDKTLLPNPSRLMKECAAMGFKVVTIIDPGIAAQAGYDVYETGLREKMFCQTESGRVFYGEVWPGGTAFPDFARKEVRTWWAGWIKRHLNLGVNGIWNDMNEPATASIDPMPMRFDGGRISHLQGHNEYALWMCQATQEGCLAAEPRKRPFVLSRGGSPGIQRYSANWCGDNCSRWEHLAMSIPMMCGVSVCGQPFVGVDIPGFFEHTNPELAVRWYQASILAPLFRNHSCCWSREQYPWSFGKAVEDCIAEVVRLRYRLMPYLYTAFARAAATGEPIFQPLYYAYQYDPSACLVEDQYLGGRDIMVAPVVTQGQTARQVYLPEGEWFHWHTGRWYQGPQYLMETTPMDYLPLFVRAGAVLPLWETAPATARGYFPRKLELRVFVPTQDGQWTSDLYEDDGETFAYQRGAYRKTKLTLRRQGKKVTLQSRSTGKGFPEYQRSSAEVVVHSQTGNPTHMRVEGCDFKISV